MAFWSTLHQRLGKLSNRFNLETHGKLIGQVHARIPMPTADEQRQKENAEADQRLWSTLHDMNSSTAADHKDLIATARNANVKNEAAAADAEANAERAKERLAKKLGRRGIANDFWDALDKHLKTDFAASGKPIVMCCTSTVSNGPIDRAL